MLQVKNISKEYGEGTVLNKISFKMAPEHKVALTGFNGTGKTTLLKIIAGEVEPDKGNIIFEKETSIGFLPQDPNQYNSENVLKFLDEYVGQNDEEFHRQVEIMFAGFGLESGIKNKKIGDLSSGQKTKIFLIGIMLKKVDLMLLDEPTNNLDLPALIWLEDFLQKTKSAFIVVSHDKTFLDNVTNKIYEIDWKERSLEISNGKYSDYLIKKQKERARQQLDHTIQKVDIKRIRNLVKVKQSKAEKGSKHKTKDNDKMLQGYFRDKAGQSYKDSRILNNRIKRMDIVERPNTRKEFNIEIDPEDSGASRDITVTDLICGYADSNETDFKIGPINLAIPFGSKVFILGLNGSGKTTLLKTLTGKIPKISGDLNVGSGVRFGNLMQEHESLDMDETILGFLLKKVESDRSVLQNHLLHFGFSEDQIKTKIKDLSPGGRARLLLALFSADNVNVLVLDEPTNHLDVEAQEALEKTLKKFEGTVITVTHDRFFMEKIAITKISDNNVLYVLTDGIMEKIKNFKQYVTDMERRSKKLLRLLNVR